MTSLCERHRERPRRGGSARAMALHGAPPRPRCGGRRQDRLRACPYPVAMALLVVSASLWGGECAGAGGGHAPVQLTVDTFDEVTQTPTLVKVRRARTLHCCGSR